VHFTSTDGAAVLPVDYTFTVADNGAHTFTATFITAGGQALSVTDTMAGITGTQAGIHVNPAAARPLLLARPHPPPTPTPRPPSPDALPHDRHRHRPVREPGHRLYRHCPLHEFGCPGLAACELHLHGSRRRTAYVHARADPVADGSPDHQRRGHHDVDGRHG